MPNRFALITLIVLAPLPALAEGVPRSPKDVVGPAEYTDDPEDRGQDSRPCGAGELSRKRNCGTPAPDPAPADPLETPSLDLPPQWRPHAGHLPAIGR